MRIDRARFRDATAPDKGQRPAPAASRRHDIPQSQDPATDDADNQLFLQAMMGADTRPAHADKARKKAQEPFLLEERRAFQHMKHNHAKKKALSVPEPAPTPTAPPPVMDAEEAAFAKAMKGVDPLQGKGRAVAPEVLLPEPPLQAELSLQDFMEGKLEFALSLTGEYLEGHVVGLDELTMNKLRAGQYSPEAHLDLHGLNAVQAFQALVGFFRGSWHKGLRTVLVVPGRGRNSPDGIGVLRDKLQSWLTEEPFKRVVLAFCTAQPTDGGAGSVYVLLRKYRKKGKIYWERTPADPDLF